MFVDSHTDDARQFVGRSRSLADVLVTCGVEMCRGGVGAAYLCPALSSAAAGASLASPCFRFHIPHHRTGWADFPLPALGERFTMSPTGDGAAAC